MKMTTEVWAKFQSIGKPDSTETVHGPLKEVVVKLALWLTKVTMGSRIEFTIARTESELETKKQPQVVSEIDDMLLKLMEMEDLNESDVVPSNATDTDVVLRGDS